MSSDRGGFAASFGGAREHPLFFPWNRRLRHLQGISVRNLNVNCASSRPGRSNTDENVEYASKSSINLLAQSEIRGLQQTRSFSNLTSPDTIGKIAVHNRPSSQDERSVQLGNAPTAHRIRRRSTLYWTGATPEARQKKLQAVAQEMLTQAWFSLHVPKLAAPIYISELTGKSVNPSFQFLDLNLSDPQVSRGDVVCLRLWVKTDRLEEFILLIELDVCLESLQFVGTSLDTFRLPLPANCIMFHFEDGIYTSFSNMSSEGQTLISRLKESRRTGAVKPAATSSYNALTRLANIDDCIQDALATRTTLEEQINGLISRNENNLHILAKKAEAEEAVRAAGLAISSEQKQIRLLKGKRNDFLASLRSRRDAIDCGRTIQSNEGSVKDGLREATHQVERRSKQTSDDFKGQARRVCEDLMLVYPIEPIKNRPLHFSIRNLFLPNSVFDDTNRDEIAAALGFTSKIVHVLSLYLFTPLPYPISSASSTSTIEDPISIAITQRIFPLYPTSISYRFEYGVFLLNKNIEFLMNKNGLRILDIRHTLPNLKYMLYVLTAGTGELPARKAGGIRGLVTGRVTPAISRQGSEDSFRSSFGFNSTLSDGAARHRSQPIQVNGKEKPLSSPLDVSGLITPSPSGKSYVYRNTSLREEAFQVND